MRGSRGGSGGSGPPPPLEFAMFSIANITGNEKNCYFFIFVHFHSYTSNRINPQNSNQITSIQVCVMGFFLLKVGPHLEKISGSAPVIGVIWECLESGVNINFNYVYTV